MFLTNTLRKALTKQVLLHLLQILSKNSRAYIYKSDGLPGFVKKFDVLELLREREKSGTLDKITEY